MLLALISVIISNACANFFRRAWSPVGVARASGAKSDGGFQPPTGTSRTLAVTRLSKPTIPCRLSSCCFFNTAFWSSPSGMVSTRSLILWQSLIAFFVHRHADLYDGHELALMPHVVGLLFFVYSPFIGGCFNIEANIFQFDIPKLQIIRH